MITSKDVVFNENVIPCLSEKDAKTSESSSTKSSIDLEKFQFEVEPQEELHEPQTVGDGGNEHKQIYSNFKEEIST